MTTYDFSIERDLDEKDRLDINIGWDSFNLVSFSIRKSQLMDLKLRIEEFLEEDDLP